MEMATENSSRGKLDLELFLRSHGASTTDDDDDELVGFRHRTVDEILDDSDSSASSVDGTSHQIVADPDSPEDSENKKESSSKIANYVALEVDSQEPPNSSTLRFSPLSSSRSLPPLVGGLLANPRPGAALAVAAAASRSVPFRAAEIKSKWTAAVDLREDDGFDASGVSFENVLDSSFHLRSPSISTASSDGNGEDILRREENALPDNSLMKNDRNVSEEKLTDSDSEAFTDIIQEEVITSNFSQEAADEHQFGEEYSLPENTDAISQENSICGLTEEGKIELDGSENVGEKESHWESNERTSRKAEKKLRSSMKPLEWAEEMEKKRASSGLHLEEGAVSQLLRLTGIRREPPAVGYLQTNSDNAVTRAFSSQIFVRDHGSPTVLAVHFNSIAVGTSKGLVLVFPSKYSSQFEDNMEGKVNFCFLSG